jgi:hypothetical protein
MNKKWDEDTAAFDEVYTHILHMSDALSDGIIMQFAGRSRDGAGNPARSIWPW